MKNKEMAVLVGTFGSRDPIAISQHLIEIQAMERERYFNAVKQEDIGAIVKKSFYDKRRGEVVEVEIEKEPNPVVTDMARTLINNGKTISNIINPPKAAPLIQHNTQYNIGGAIAERIKALPEEEMRQAIVYIDEKLNA